MRYILALSALLGAWAPGAAMAQGAAPEPFTLTEQPQTLLLSAARYQLEIARDPFALRLTRGPGAAILETVQPGGEIGASDFRFGGKTHQTRKLQSFTRTQDSVTLMYATSLPGARLRIELRPTAGYVRVSQWVLYGVGDIAPAIRFRMAPSGHWYGGGFQSPMVLPLNEASFDKESFYINAATQASPIWYTTSGLALWVRTPHDFRYAIAGQVLTIEMPGVTSLDYDLLVAADARQAVRFVLDQLGHSNAIPPADYLRLPGYSTWVEHKLEVSQAKVLEYAASMKKAGLPCGTLVIDDKWESEYGDLRLDPVRFPQPRAMVDQLHRYGCRVMLWIHPFANLESEAYRSPANRKDFIQDLSGRPALVTWWRGVGGIWDFTNPEVAERFRGRLRELEKALGLDGFKFDSGDVNRVPPDARAARPLTSMEFADIYNRETAAHWPWSETRVGIYSGKLGVVERMYDKESDWSTGNGLGAIIPEALLHSMRGFPYLMADMVGGNEYENLKIDGELMVRWAQTTALLPLMQFSRAPWAFDEQTARLCREAAALHTRFAPFTYRLAQEWTRHGEPIVRPLWYNHPGDPEVATIVDQFMLGEDVLVAPVLRHGAVSRDIYLPAGAWQELRNGTRHQGGRWLRNHPAPLDTLPVFVRAGLQL